MPNFSVILAAAGRSSRFNDPQHKKPFALLNQKAIWLYSAEIFSRRQDVKQLLIVIAPDDKDEFYSQFGSNIAMLGVDIVLGGNERADSVELALQAVSPTSDFVAIHDAARPCLDAELVERVFQAGVQTGAAIPAVPVHSTIKRSLNGKRVDETVDRRGLYLAQTPQVYRRELINDLYAKRNSVDVTDESQLAEQHGVEVAIVTGSPLNIKVTTKQDLFLAKACLQAIPPTRFDAPIQPTAGENLLR